jgi:hypothetical protein
LHDQQSRNAQVLGCLRLDREGRPVAGQRLAFGATTGRDGRPGRAGEGSDKPEGLEVQRSEGRLLAWVAYDDPSVARRQGLGVRTRLDGFVVPD